MDGMAEVRCHYCGITLPLKGRSTECYLPCCGEDECRKAAKRRYAAEARARKRASKSAAGITAATSS